MHYRAPPLDFLLMPTIFALVPQRGGGAGDWVCHIAVATYCGGGFTAACGFEPLGVHWLIVANDRHDILSRINEPLRLHDCRACERVWVGEPIEPD